MDEDFRDLLIDLTEEVKTLRAQLKNQECNEEFINENETVDLLKVSKVTLNTWRNDGVLKIGKHYVKISRSIRYKKNALLNFSR
tara:strand:- start:658 stop:909 length:252 start_codon:yes stop_codon:yes gene_type:complete